MASPILSCAWWADERLALLEGATEWVFRCVYRLAFDSLASRGLPSWPDQRAPKFD